MMENQPAQRNGIVIRHTDGTTVTVTRGSDSDKKLERLENRIIALACCVALDAVANLIRIILRM